MKFFNEKRFFFWLVSLFVAAMLLQGCGGGGSGGGGGTTTGTFIDSPVEGLSYSINGGARKETGTGGTFTFSSGSTIQFFVGDIAIGDAVTAAVTMTPVNLVAGATDETNPIVTNIARFLQTIDDDGDPDNGITITQNVRDLAASSALDFNQTGVAFGNDGAVQTLVATLTAATTAGARILVSEAAAQQHLNQSLLGIFAGSYSGRYSGDDTGTWSIVVAENGAITGSGNSNSIGSFQITGNVTSNGASNFADGNAAGATFSGTFNANGTASGTWDASPDTGTWSGTKQ